MFSHVTMGTNDLERAVAFFDPVLGELGYARWYKDEGAAAYGSPNGPSFWILHPYDGNRATPGNGPHVALLAQTRAEVRAFHAAALKAGGGDEGAPGARPHYHPNYFGAYIRDLDGNKLQAVCHRRDRN